LYRYKELPADKWGRVMAQSPCGQAAGTARLFSSAVEIQQAQEFGKPLTGSASKGS